MKAATAHDWQARKVNNWLLAVLRFSLTLEPEDRAHVLAMADEIDRLQFVADQPKFSFFLRTSVELCNAVADLEYPGRNEVLHRHITRIDNPRLRRAFSAAVALERRDAPKPIMPFRADRARLPRC